MADQDTDEPKKKGGLVKILGFIFAGVLLVALVLARVFFFLGARLSRRVMKSSKLLNVS